ncbi:MAG TPA: 2-hydroxymuconic semialdehyde dehydrogenase [Flavobacteriaceae bacterium]|nr:2-hydroxymuconic semialdehyde dehydrogenase [Flavobacteriaceae bacterium]
MAQVLNYINGTLQHALSGERLDNIEPATGQIYGSLPQSSDNDVALAFQAAKNAFITWRQTTLEQRSALLARIADLIDENLERLAQAESKDSGKPLSLAKTIDIPRASSNFRFFAHALTQFSSEAHESVGQNTINFTLRHPIGVVGCISPWNLPLYLFTWKIAPALAAGNTVVAKPSELTPVTAHLLAELCQQAGLPAGVLNIVHGTGASAGQAIIAHPEIKAISFTGGTATGAHIAKVAAPMLKKLSLELGGKNPNIIFADCDYPRMLEITLKSSFANQGQICLCGSRIFVERSIYAKFKEDFVSRVTQLRVGPPNHEVDLGAVISKEHRQKILNYIDLAQNQGGLLLCGGNKADVPQHPEGYYLEPTVIEVNDHLCRVNQEEIFGPVVTIMPFDSEAQVIEMANSVPYGLSASLWTSDLDRSMRFGQQLESGIVWVNTWLNRDLRTPFGGVKASGVGREGGFEALRFFTEPKNICISYKP